MTSHSSAISLRTSRAAMDAWSDAAKAAGYGTLAAWARAVLETATGMSVEPLQRAPRRPPGSIEGAADVVKALRLTPQLLAAIHSASDTAALPTATWAALVLSAAAGVSPLPSQFAAVAPA